MRRHIIWAVTVMAAVLVQATWLPNVRIGGGMPDLALMLVVYFAITEGDERAMYTGLLAGIFQDVASDARLGHHVLCLVVIGYIAGRFSLRLVTEHPAVKAGLVFLASMLHGIIYTVIQYVQDPAATRVFATVVAVVLPTAFYTAIVTPVFFWLLEVLFRRLFPVHAGGGT